tara:strand:- start:1959 stop:2612 length:654 start_codon:yes stop_codon:yes gene_type:complete
MEHGHWKRFVEIREGMKGDGVDASDAWGHAAAALEKELEEGREEDHVGGDVEVEKVKPRPMPAPVVQASVSDMDGDRVSKRSFIGRSCSTPETVEWVAANVLLEDAVPEDAPSPEAWGMLCWARRSNTNEAQFWGQIYTKLLPSRTSLEADARYRDDGRQLSGLIDLLQMEADNEKETPREVAQSDRDVDAVTDGGATEVGDVESEGSASDGDGNQG